MIARAQQQAATIDERARQEYAWRRRQMRQEQALLDQRRSAILGQLSSLSALAAETAGNLPEVPEILFSEFENLSSGTAAEQQGSARAEEQTVVRGTPEAPQQQDGDAGQRSQDDEATTVRYLGTRSA